MCSLEDYKKLVLDETHRGFVEDELEFWHECYLPVGKTVLDVGAGCGETAFFYLSHGAERVICVEADPAALDLLRRNFGHDDRITIVPAVVNSIKIDIEGHEEGLVLETHFPVKFKLAKRLEGHIRLWRVKRMVPLSSRLHKLRISIAHTIRTSYDAVLQRQK